MGRLTAVCLLGSIGLFMVDGSLLSKASPLVTNSSGNNPDTSGDATPVYRYNIRNTYPHDRDAFTQGLAFDDGLLYEGTGRFGRSTLRKVELETGKILKIHQLPARFFGEGVTILRDRIIQLTWRSKLGFIYDKHSFRIINEFEYPTEGWGITHDGKRLFMSDGTSVLRLLDPETLRETGRIQVHDSNGPVGQLNELEYVQGEIYANVWKTDCIARISPRSGRVLGWIDLTGLLRPEDRDQSVDVLNGIAYDANNDRLFVTGKLWPKLFEIRLVPDKETALTFQCDRASG